MRIDLIRVSGKVSSALLSGMFEGRSNFGCPHI